MKPKRPELRNYAIGLVLYHPEEALLKRVELMVNLGFHVYVFDNSPFDSQYSHIIKNNTSVDYLTAGKNVGIGYSLSTLCATAYAHGYSHLLFLDQDTGISEITLEFIDNFSVSLQDNIKQHYAAVVFNGSPADTQSVQEVRLAISSGSLFNLTILKYIGWHNENYFVDCVDYELCLRTRRLGYKIGIVRNTPDFDHVSEQPDKSISIFGKRVLVRRYSSRRIADAIRAYVKIIFGGLFINKISDTFVMMKSLVIYTANQLIARLIRFEK